MFEKAPEVAAEKRADDGDEVAFKLIDFPFCGEVKMGCFVVVVGKARIGDPLIRFRADLLGVSEEGSREKRTIRC